MSEKKLELIQKLRANFGNTQKISDDDLLLDAVEKYIYIKKSLLPDLHQRVTGLIQMLSSNN